MKFIIDAQLPISLSNLLKSRGQDSIHTLELADKDKYSFNINHENHKVYPYRLNAFNNDGFKK